MRRGNCDPVTVSEFVQGPPRPRQGGFQPLRIVLVRPQGTGTTQIQPTLIVSQVYSGRFEPLFNLGVDFNANDLSRSIVRWRVGGTYQAMEQLSASVVFLERNDIYDASVGPRWRFADSGFVGVNALVPLNSDGFRPDAIPTVEASYAF